MIFILYSAAVLALMGYLIKNKKWYWLISGYNTADKKRKESIDIEGLASFLALQLYIMAGIFIFAYILDYLKFGMGSMLMFFLIIPQSIYFIFKSVSYDSGSKNEDGSYKMSVKITIGILLVTFLFVGGLLYLSIIPAQYHVGEESFEIKGIYGREVFYSDIRDLEVSSEMPRILWRTNGSSIGEIKKGKFALEDRSRALLFIEKSEPPYLIIKHKEEVIIINTKDGQKVLELFTEISAFMDK